MASDIFPVLSSSRIFWRIHFASTHNITTNMPESNFPSLAYVHIIRWWIWINLKQAFYLAAATAADLLSDSNMLEVLEVRANLQWVLLLKIFCANFQANLLISGYGISGWHHFTIDKFLPAGDPGWATSSSFCHQIYILVSMLNYQLN